jgi:hypothetical protein
LRLISNRLYTYSLIPDPGRTSEKQGHLWMKTRGTPFLQKNNYQKESTLPFQTGQDSTSCSLTMCCSTTNTPATLRWATFLFIWLKLTTSPASQTNSSSLLRCTPTFYVQSIKWQQILGSRRLSKLSEVTDRQRDQKDPRRSLSAIRWTKLRESRSVWAFR